MRAFTHAARSVPARLPRPQERGAMYAIARTVDPQPCSVHAMNTHSPDPFIESSPASLGWRTSSLGHAAIASTAELSELGAHLRRCSCASGHLFALRCGGEALHGFLAARVVTTLVISAVVIGAVVMALPAG
jgi:hypothetical protein